MDIYKIIEGITVKHKVGSNDDSEMVSQFSSSSPTGQLKIKGSSFFNLKYIE